MRAQIYAGILTTLSVAVAAAADISQSVRDWHVDCDTDRLCDARTDVTDIGGPMQLMLRRNDDIGAPIDVIWRFETPPPVGSRIRLQLNDVEYAISGEIVRIRPDNEVWWPGYEPGEKLLQMLRQSQIGTVTITIADSTERDEGSVSLNGVTSALAVFDLVQRRLDRTDAAVVVGAIAANEPSQEYFGFAPEAPIEAVTAADQKGVNQPSSDTPSSMATTDPIESDSLTVASVTPEAAEGSATVAETEPAPSPASESLLFSRTPFEVRLRTQLPSGLVRELTQTYFCRTAELLETTPAIAYPIDSERTLWRIPCNTTAFHATHMFVESSRGSRGDLTVHTFGYPPTVGFDAETDTVDPSFDITSGRLTSFVKSRSQGDCGIFAAYLWTGEGFDLEEYRQKVECDGTMDDPQSYPVIWRNS